MHVGAVTDRTTELPEAGVNRKRGLGLSALPRLDLVDLKPGETPRVGNLKRKTGAQDSTNPE